MNNLYEVTVLNAYGKENHSSIAVPNTRHNIKALNSVKEERGKNFNLNILVSLAFDYNTKKKEYFFNAKVYIDELLIKDEWKEIYICLEKI
jgi:hypothetical protein